MKSLQEERFVSTRRTIEPAILLVEDQPNDAMLMEIAIERAGLDNPLVLVRDGQDAIEYLQGKGCYSDRTAFPIPDLILLDLKMPRLDGFGVLEWLQERPEFDRIATVVLSSSNIETDLIRAHTLGADDYLIKPLSNNELAEMVLALHDRWLSADSVEG